MQPTPIVATAMLPEGPVPLFLTGLFLSTAEWRLRGYGVAMGRTAFSHAEIGKLRECLTELRRAERGRQRTLRSSMRRIGFYITDFSTDGQGFTVSDLDDLIRRGVIQVTD
jgi:hypothetical protein